MQRVGGCGEGGGDWWWMALRARTGAAVFGRVRESWGVRIVLPVGLIVD